MIHGERILSPDDLPLRGIEKWRESVSEKVPIDVLKRYDSQKLVLPGCSAEATVYNVWSRFRIRRHDDCVTMERHIAPPAFAPPEPIPQGKNGTNTQLSPVRG